MKASLFSAIEEFQPKFSDIIQIRINKLTRQKGEILYG